MIELSDYKKYIIFKDEVIGLTKGLDGFWRDEYGTLWAYAEVTASVDNRPVCGIGFLSLPEDHPLNDACKPHDYMYQSPVFQAFNSRAEADRRLEELAVQIKYPVTGALFNWISQLVGACLWENKKTR